MNNHGEQASPDPGRIAYLVNGFLQDNLTEPERDELDEWIEAAPENMKLFEELTDEENLQAAQTWFQKQEANKKRKRTRYQDIRRGIRSGVPSLIWYLAAACIVALFIGVYWLTKTAIVTETPPTAKRQADIEFDSSKTVLILSNGQLVSLDSVQTVKQKDFTIENGSVVYSPKSSTDTVYNSVVVPTGKQLKIQLSDGSNVWLNASSTMRYPVAFSTNSRTVELTGEGYFEVKHDSAKPFTVTSGEQTVTVLGTGFNINVYQNEKPTTTLIHGSVKISTPTTSKMLNPGEQSEVSGREINIKKVDLSEIVAWKEGLFLFRSAPIETVAAQLQRWYNVEIEYRGKPKEHFNATIKRTESLQRVLQILEGSGYVHFQLEGRKLIVQP